MESGLVLQWLWLDWEGPPCLISIVSPGIGWACWPILTPALAYQPLSTSSASLYFALASCWKLQLILCSTQLGLLTCSSSQAHCLDVALRGSLH